MRQFNIYEVKTHFSQFVHEASKGETLVIAKSGTPIAKLSPIDKEKKKLLWRFDVMKNKIKFSRDFDAPLSKELLALFEKG